MTAPARISKADMDRANRSVKEAGFERARIVFRLDKAEIEVIIGESDVSEQTDYSEWADDDV